MDANKNYSQKEFMGKLSGLMKSLERLEKLAWKWTDRQLWNLGNKNPDNTNGSLLMILPHEWNGNPRVFLVFC